MDLVASDAWQLVQNVKNLHDNIEVIYPGSKSLLEGLVAVHADYSMTDLVVITLLDTAEKLDCDPLLGALS